MTNNFSGLDELKQKMVSFIQGYKSYVAKLEQRIKELEAAKI